jgi:hypothetical protein
MTNATRSALPMFLAAAISIVVALATGAAWIGQPFRAVQLVTLVGLSITAGISLMQALMRLRK